MSRRTDYKSTYVRAYENLGYRLTSRNGASRRAIEAAERRLGFSAPHALAEYFSVAGRETRFNGCYNRLLSPEDWFVDANRLVFMEENQAVVYWSVPADKRRLDDPPVYQGVNGTPIRWRRESEHCSFFLTVMLHWHGAFGGALPEAHTALAPLGIRKSLRASWQFIGEVNRMQAFAQPGKAICHLKWDDGWRAFAGATTKRQMKEIAEEFSLDWLA